MGLGLCLSHWRGVGAFLFAGLREFVSKVTALGAGIHD